MRLEQLTLDDWTEQLPDSGFEVFHTPEALSVLDEHTAGDLHLFGGFKGQQAIALLPLFVRRRSVGAAVTSPPPGRNVPRLGPILMPTSPKRRKQEKVNREFAELVVDELDLEASTTLFRMVCHTDYLDPRPYVWNGFDLDTSFTYMLDVDEKAPDELLASCSKSLRREIRDARELDLTIEDEGVSGAREIYGETVDRYEEQDRSFPASWAYVRDLVKALDERCRAYVVRSPDGEFLTGITVLYSNDAAYFWQGGTRGTYENVTVNSLLHWRIVEDLVEDPPIESVGAYDLMGANTERLCRYKSKFGAELVPYYVVESGGAPMEMAKRAYGLVSR
ncbi:GNAT family N-acetyltransferase (plasmid) [Haloferacaceae archaeon DSL9]